MKAKHIIITVAISILVIASLFTFFTLRNKAAMTVSLAFYGLPTEIIESITTTANQAQTEQNLTIKIISLDDSKSLSEQRALVRTVDILFAMQSKALEEIQEDLLPVSNTLVQHIPSSIREAGAQQGKRYAIPLLLDHVEFAWNRKLLTDKKVSTPKTLSAFENVARLIKGRTLWPLVCAGAVDEELVLFFGALVESLEGAAAHELLIKQMSEGLPFEAIANEPSIARTLSTLVSWRKSGILHPEWFRMGFNDVESFMENNYAAFVVMSFGMHRKISHRVVERFDSSYIPSDRTGTVRSFTTPVLLASRVAKKRPSKEAAAFFASLLHSDTQTRLGALSGLAPVHASAEVADTQAYDVRLFAASSMKPLPNITTAAFSNKKAQADFTSSLRSYIESNGL